MHSAYLRELENNNYLSLIQRGLEWIQFESLLPSSGARVFIKPNLTFPTYRPGVMTSPEAIEAAILAIREYTPNIILGDADSGGYNCFSMSEVYKETGIADFAQRQDAADGQVDAARNDHQGHAAGQDAVYGNLPEHVSVRVPFEEGPVGVERCSQCHDEHQGEHRPRCRRKQHPFQSSPLA